MTRTIPKECKKSPIGKHEYINSTTMFGERMPVIRCKHCRVILKLNASLPEVDK